MFNLPFNSSNLLILTVFAVLQGFLVLIVVFLFVDKFFSSRRQRIETYKLKEEAYKQAQDVLASAQDSSERLIIEAEAKAKTLLLEAEKKASQLISHSEIFSKNIQNEFENSIRVIIKEKSSSLGSIIDGLQKGIAKVVEDSRVTTIATLDASTGAFSSALMSHLDEYKSLLVQKGDKVSEDMQSLLMSHIAETKARTEEFEKAHIKRLTDRSLEVISYVTQKYVHKDMSKQDKESAILEMVSEITLDEFREK